MQPCSGASKSRSRTPFRQLIPETILNFLFYGSFRSLSVFLHNQQPAHQDGTDTDHKD